MQIIIEVKNHRVFQRLLELLRGTDWFGGIRVWKKSDEYAAQEIVYDSIQSNPKSNPKDISHLAGSWKDWDDREFADLLRITYETRSELFTPRQINL